MLRNYMRMVTIARAKIATAQAQRQKWKCYASTPTCLGEIRWSPPFPPQKKLKFCKLLRAEGNPKGLEFEAIGN